MEHKRHKAVKNEMKLIQYIYTIGQKLTSIRRVPYENLYEKAKYRDALPEPKTLLERSYLQYSCQYHEHILARFLLNIACAPLAILIWIKALIENVKYKKKTIESKFEECIGILDIDKDLIPSTLLDRYGLPKLFPLRGRINFDRDAFKLLNKALRIYWYEPHFLSKLFLRIGRYSYLISTTNSKVIIASAEYSFASSVLTWFCEVKFIKHINIMHGEKFINPVDAFCRFHEFYVWDDHYKNIFEKLRAKVDHYIVDKPVMLTNIKKIKSSETKYDLTYYLGWELSTQDLENIRNVLIVFLSRQRRICIRMHPYYGNRLEIRKIFLGFEIETPEKVTLMDSLASTRMVVSLSTTVFWHARELGLPIIIDDVSNTDYYKKLFDIEYLWVSKSHKCLSNLSKLDDI